MLLDIQIHKCAPHSLYILKSCQSPLTFAQSGSKLLILTKIINSALINRNTVSSRVAGGIVTGKELAMEPIPDHPIGTRIALDNPILFETGNIPVAGIQSTSRYHFRTFYSVSFKSLRTFPTYRTQIRAIGRV